MSTTYKSRAAFVRSLSASTPVKEVVRLGKRAGFEIKPEYVHTLQSGMRKAPPAGTEIRLESDAQKSLLDLAVADVPHTTGRNASLFDALELVHDALLPLSREQQERVMRAAHFMLGWDEST